MKCDIEPWVCRIPFGTPVEPEVKATLAMSCGPVSLSCWSPLSRGWEEGAGRGTGDEGSNRNTARGFASRTISASRASG